jgi:hypothetical protein
MIKYLLLLTLISGIHYNFFYVLWFMIKKRNDSEFDGFYFAASANVVFVFWIHFFNLI